MKNIIRGNSGHAVRNPRSVMRRVDIGTEMRS